MYNPKRMLVTGGAGFIGANFIRYLLNADPDLLLVNLDCLTYAGSLKNLEAMPHAERYHFVSGNISDAFLIKHLLREYRVDTIVHFAAESHVDRSIAGPSAFIQTNLVGTFTLLEAARQYWLEECHFSDAECRFHHISTDEVYGSLAPTDPAFTEYTQYAPNSPYSASKAGSDHLVRAYFHTYRLPVTTTNCSNNYGPYQHAEKFIPTVIRACLNEQPIPVYGSGGNIRDWLYVEDHCRAVDTVIRRGVLGEVYNIGGCNEWRNIDIVHKICSLLDEYRPNDRPYHTLITYVKDRLGHDWRYAIDARKIKQSLGWQPTETFDTGIVKTLQHYLNESVVA